MVATVDGSRKVPLISEKYRTSSREKLVIPFNVINLTRSPKLDISFVVKTRGHCRQTYEDTEIIMNDILVQSIDFRELNDEQVVDLSINLPLESINQGDNLLVIAMGSCDYDLDSMQLNRTSLSF